MENEIWKDIPGYEGRYQASTLGRIRSLDRKVRVVIPNTGKPHFRNYKGQVLRPGRYCKSGHLSVVLGHGKAGAPVHQLVASTFLGPCPKGCEVLHANGNPTDNRVKNLRYGTRTENIIDVFRCGGKWRKLDVEDVRQIRFCLAMGMTYREIASMYSVSISNISAIKNGRTFSWLR